MSTWDNHGLLNPDEQRRWLKAYQRKSLREAEREADRIIKKQGGTVTVKLTHLDGFVSVMTGPEFLAFGKAHAKTRS